MRFFSQYYNRPYPGDKLDLIAIPDFASRAMENLGAITFSETALAVGPTLAHGGARDASGRITDVVAHEKAPRYVGSVI